METTCIGRAGVAVVRVRRGFRPRMNLGLVRFDEEPPPGAPRLHVDFGEDTARAVAFAQETLAPLLAAGKPVVLDFRNTTAFSQSYLHALLFSAVRLAWATGAPLHVHRASPVVRSGIEWVESYALAG